MASVAGPLKKELFLRLPVPKDILSKELKTTAVKTVKEQILLVLNPTICPRSIDQFCIIIYNIKSVTTSWTHSK